jgi:chloramphenicol-sensitive protein RarD
VNDVSQTHRGYLFGVAAYLCWGMFPLYWKLLRPATPVEILAHRIFWTFLTIAVFVTALRGWRRVAGLARQPRQTGILALAAVLIAVNWGGYIVGVTTDRVVETSLGYFILPLVTVLLGVVVLRERLRVVQWVAVGLGGVAVGVLTVDYGHVPYLALLLAGTFAVYGLLKKRLAARPLDGLLIESGVLALPAAGFVVLLAARGDGTLGTVSPGHTALLVLGGAVTAVPLLFFAAAANRVPLSVLGLLQYLNPVLQFGLAVLVYSEPMPPVRLLGFALVWAALAVFTADGLRRRRPAEPVGGSVRRRANVSHRS